MRGRNGWRRGKRGAMLGGCEIESWVVGRRRKTCKGVLKKKRGR